MGIILFFASTILLFLPNIEEFCGLTHQDLSKTRILKENAK